MIDHKKISVRRAIIDDHKQLLEFEQGVIIAERPYDETLGGDPISYYDIKTLMESPEAEVLVAIYNNQIIASGYAKILKSQAYLVHDKHGYLGFMYVSPAFRGLGVNKLIVEDLFKWLRSKDINEARLDVYDENASAIKAYEKVGFEPYLLNMRISI